MQIKAGYSALQEIETFIKSNRFNSAFIEANNTYYSRSRSRTELTECRTASPSSSSTRIPTIDTAADKNHPAAQIRNRTARSAGRDRSGLLEFAGVWKRAAQSDRSALRTAAMSTVSHGED